MTLLSDKQLADELYQEFLRHPKVTLSDAWGKFIDQWEWQWFTTFTFASDVHPERAEKLFNRWKSKLNKQLYGTNWRKRPPGGIQYVLAEERHKSGQVHLHALINGVETTRRLTWMDAWEEQDPSCGYSRIEPVKDGQKASLYVAKYVPKGGEISFSPNLKEIQRDLFRK